MIMTITQLSHGFVATNETPKLNHDDAKFHSFVTTKIKRDIEIKSHRHKNCSVVVLCRYVEPINSYRCFHRTLKTKHRNKNCYTIIVDSLQMLFGRTFQQDATAAKHTMFLGLRSFVSHKGAHTVNEIPTANDELLSAVAVFLVVLIVNTVECSCRKQNTESAGEKCEHDDR